MNILEIKVDEFPVSCSQCGFFVNNYFAKVCKAKFAMHMPCDIRLFLETRPEDCPLIEQSVTIGESSNE